MLFKIDLVKNWKTEANSTPKSIKAVLNTAMRFETCQAMWLELLGLYEYRYKELFKAVREHHYGVTVNDRPV